MFFTAEFINIGELFKTMKTKVMYIENKSSGHHGPA